MSEETIKRLLNTGKVTIGSEVSIKMLKSGKLRAVIMSSNCPTERMTEIKKLAGNMRLYKYPGTSLELGEVCGRPFPVSVIGVVDPGDADLSVLGGI